jgi:hypothetical protein
MLLETLKKILAAVGVYLCLLATAKVAVHTSYAISGENGKRLALCMCLMALLFFLLFLLVPVVGG